MKGFYKALIFAGALGTPVVLNQFGILNFEQINNFPHGKQSETVKSKPEALPTLDEKVALVKQEIKAKLGEECLSLVEYSDLVHNTLKSQGLILGEYDSTNNRAESDLSFEVGWAIKGKLNLEKYLVKQNQFSFDVYCLPGAKFGEKYGVQIEQVKRHTAIKESLERLK